MTAVITANIRASRDTVAPPPSLKEDGGGYLLRMFYEDGRYIADADTTVEMLDVLIPGYSDEEEENRLRLRLDFAKEVQTQARAVILSNLTPENNAVLADWEYDLLSWTETVDPSGWGKRVSESHAADEDSDAASLDSFENDLGEPVDVWYSETPLVLIDAFYAPFTATPRPISAEGDYTFVSNLIWITVTDEYEFLQSLSRIGLIRFGVPSVPAVV